MTTKFFTGGALTALAAALAFTAVPASAQDRHHNDRDSHGWSQSNHNDRDSDSRHNDSAPAWGSRNKGDQPQRTNTPAATQSHGQWTGRHEDQRAQSAQRDTSSRRVPGWNDPALATRGDHNRTYTDQGRNSAYVDRGRNTTYVDRNRNTTYRNDRRDNDRHWSSRDDNQRWDRNWRTNNRYDWQRYRTYNRNVYHLGRYYSPYRNYDYRRLSIGFRLDPLFFGQDYWIGDPGYYRLPDVYGPYRWVRYYDDALLVDVYSGEVVDVIYDFFW